MNPDRVTGKVVVVDDEPRLLESWQEALGQRFDVKLFSDPIAAARFFETGGDVDVALLDIRMPGMSGLALLEHLKKQQPAAEAIIITGHGTIQSAVQAIQMGAYDFLCKPVEDLDGAIRRIESALERKQLKQLNKNLGQSLSAFIPEHELIGDSRAIRKIRELVAQIASSCPCRNLWRKWDGQGTGCPLLAHEKQSAGQAVSRHQLCGHTGNDHR